MSPTPRRLSAASYNAFLPHRENPTPVAFGKEAKVSVEGCRVPEEDRAAAGLRFPDCVAESLRFAGRAVRDRRRHLPPAN